MFEKIILHEKGLDVKLTDHVNDDIIDILEHAVQGAEGGLRFSQTNIRSRIEEYGDKVRFMSLYKKNRIAGTAGAYYHITGQGALEYPSTYIGYYVETSGIDEIEKFILEKNKSKYKRRSI